MVVSQDFNWNMISALAQVGGIIATFTAVLVALQPIFTERKRNKAVAINLRARILGSLMILRPALDNLANPHKLLDTTKTTFTEA